MAKYKVLKRFRDKESRQLNVVDDVIDITVARADEILSKGEYIKRINEPKKKKEKTPVEE